MRKRNKKSIQKSAKNSIQVHFNPTKALQILKDSPNALMLLLLYIDKRKIQKKEAFICTEKDIKKELGWGHDKIRKYKKILINLGIIDSNFYRFFWTVEILENPIVEIIQ